MATISKREKQTDHLPINWPEKFYDRPSPMPCANTDACPREHPTAGGGRVNPIAARLRRRPSIPNTGDESGFKSKGGRQHGGGATVGRQKGGAEWKEFD